MLTTTQGQASLLGAFNVLVALAAAAISLRLAFMFVQAVWRYFTARSLLVQAFAKADGLDIGGAFALLIRNSMGRLSESGEDIRIDLASRWADPVTISSDLASAIPQGALVSGLIQLVALIAPNHDRVLTGSLQTTSPRGPGVTAALEWRGGGIIDTITIWQDELPSVPAAPPAAPPDMKTFSPFAFAVAVWTAQKMDPKGFARMGTGSWLSYVAFSAGDRAQRAGYFATARDLYLRALASDPANEPARFNLGVVELRLAMGVPSVP